MITVSSQGRRFYRLRTPSTNGTPSTACSTSVDEVTGQLNLAVGQGRRMHLSPDEAWTLWRCLSEAVASLGAPPEHVQTNLRPMRRSA